MSLSDVAARSRRWKIGRPLGLCLVASLSLPAFNCHTSAATFGTNLIINGDAESGTGSASGNDIEIIPDWSTQTGTPTVVQYGAPDFPSSSSPGPADRGNNFFAGGPNVGDSVLQQGVDVSSLSTQIDVGDVSFDATGYFGGFSSQEDNAQMSGSFLNASNIAIGTFTVPTVTAEDRDDITGLLLESDSASLPVGTRTIQIDLTMIRDDGSYDDGYADNLALVLSDTSSPSTVPLPAAAGPATFLLAALLAAKKLRAIRA